jgi:hypothetical protein
MIFFDTDVAMTRAIPTLMAIDKEIVAWRYFSRGNQSKCLSNAECRAVAAADAKLRPQSGYFLVGIVYEMGAAPLGSAMGRADGSYTRMRLAQIGAPAGAMVAAVHDADYPSSTAQANAMVDYFAAFFGELPNVTAACYGAGATYDLLRASRVPRLANVVRWTTQSGGFAGSRADVAAGDYDIRQGFYPTGHIAGLDADPDYFRPGLIPVGKTPESLGFFVPRLPAPSLPDAVLPGSDHDDVAALQLALNAKDNASLSVDGVYGSATTAAVSSFQTQHGLSIDGLAGPLTIAAIKALA